MTPTPVQLLEGELDDAPRRVAEAIADVAGAGTALYLLDLEGRELVRLAGDAGLPEAMELEERIGPVLFHGCEGDVEAAVAAAVPGAHVRPLWLRGQATCIAVLGGPPGADLSEILDTAAVVIEIARDHTDVIQSPRRRKPTTTAAELQQDLLPPQIARSGDTELAGAIMPAYTVGGDWFDWTYGPGTLRFSVGDAVGRGTRAMAVGAVGLSANRAARRRDESIEEAATHVNEAIRDLGGEVFVTCVLASFDPRTATVHWLRCGHPVPVLVHDDGSIAQLPTAGYLPLGTYDEAPRFELQSVRLEPGDRFVVYSDGITEARRHDGSFFGLEGLLAALDRGGRAAGTVRATLNQLDQEAEAIDDDATLLVLRRDPAAG